MANEVKNLVMDTDLGAELIVFLREKKKIQLDLDEDDLSDVEAALEIVEGGLEFIASKLAEVKTKEGKSTLEVPGLLTFGIDYREGNGKNGNWGIGVEVGEEMKKPIKLLDDDDEDEEGSDEE